MPIQSLMVALEATLDCPEAAAHAMRVVVPVPLVADVNVHEFDFQATLRAQILSLLVVLELGQTGLAYHMPEPSVNRIELESQAHNAGEVIVGLQSPRFGHEVEVLPRLLGLIIGEVSRFARRIVGSHVASKIQTLIK